MILQSTITRGCPVNPTLSLKIQLRLNRKGTLARNISTKHQEKEIRSCKSREDLRHRGGRNGGRGEKRRTTASRGHPAASGRRIRGPGRSPARKFFRRNHNKSCRLRSVSRRHFSAAHLQPIIRASFQLPWG